MRMVRLLCTAAVLAAACSGSAQAPAKAPANHAEDPAAKTAADPLAFLPADADVVLGFDFKTLRASALWKDFQPVVDSAMHEMSDSAAFKNCVAGAVDTLGSITLAVKLGNDEASGVFVIRGVDAPGMANCLERELRTAQVVETVDRGVVVAKTPHSKASLGAVGGSTIVVHVDPAASHDTFTKVLATGVPLRASAGFLGLYDRLEKGASLWAVLNGNAKMFEQLQALGARARSADGTIVVTDKIAIAGRLTVDSPEAASKLADMVTPQLGSVKPMFDRVDVTAAGDAVHLDAVMTGPQLKQLLSLIGIR